MSFTFVSVVTTLSCMRQGVTLPNNSTAGTQSGLWVVIYGSLTLKWAKEHKHHSSTCPIGVLNRIMSS
jgi:hypothetical protein